MFLHSLQSTAMLVDNIDGNACLNEIIRFKLTSKCSVKHVMYAEYLMLLLRKSIH
jgi:hypothetical protein